MGCSKMAFQTENATVTAAASGSTKISIVIETAIAIETAAAIETAIAIAIAAAIETAIAIAIAHFRMTWERRPN